MANTTNDYKKSANGLASDLAYKAHESKNQLSQMAYDSGEKIGSVASDFASSAMDTVRYSQEYVKKNPYKGVAIAATAGIFAGTVLSSLMRGRRRD